MLRLQAAAFGIGEALGGKLEGGKIDQDIAGTRETVLEPGGQRSDERGGLRIGPDDWERVRKQPCPLRIRRSNPPGGHQCERFALAQRMAFGGADDVLLTVLAHGAQGVGEGRPDCPLVDLALDGGSELGGQGQPAHDPRLASAEYLRRACQTEPVLIEQGLDDARLVHRGRRARRSVRAQQ
jgi:hypothetical protein